MLVRDLHVRVINAATGELLRELTLNPDRDLLLPNQLQSAATPRCPT